MIEIFSLLIIAVMALVSYVNAVKNDEEADRAHSLLNAIAHTISLVLIIYLYLNR